LGEAYIQLRAFLDPTSLSIGTCSGNWSPWLDRDDPSGSADGETLSAFVREQTLKDCTLPVAVQARIKGSDDLSTLEKVKFSIKTGLMCTNSEQTDSKCKDYEIRFCCPQGYY
jgi:hypothetical protein